MLNKFMLAAVAGDLRLSTVEFVLACTITARWNESGWARI